MEFDHGDCSSSGSPWQPLPTSVQLHILSLLDPNSRALSCRLVSPDARDAFSGVEHCTVCLSQPLPAHAVPWALAAGRQHVRQLPFMHKFQLPSTAAASGCEVNLEVALALLKPSIFPEKLHVKREYSGPDPGVAAVKAGHPQLLGWLVRHCPGLLFSPRVLTTAARHCNLAGLQATWEALPGEPDIMLGSSSSSSSTHPISVAELLEAAAGSVTADAVAKMEWLLLRGGGSGRMHYSIAVAAARSGDLGRLRWLRESGCPGLSSVLETALEHADLAVAQWLLDEAGCCRPAAGSDGGVRWEHLFQVTAKSPDHLAKWQWLQALGAPPLHGGRWVAGVALAAASVGQVGAVRYLLSVFGANRVLGDKQEALALAAARSGSVEVAACLREAGLQFDHVAYVRAAAYGSRGLPLMRWLAREARVSAAELPLERLTEIINSWPGGTPTDSRALLEAVQLLVDEAGFSSWGEDSRLPVISGMERGDLPLVQYLQSHYSQLGADWRVVEAAATAGCEAVLGWLAQQTDLSSLPPEVPSLYYYHAAARNDRATLTTLRRMGMPWRCQDLVAQATRVCRMPALRWLVEQGAPLGSV